MKFNINGYIIPNEYKDVYDYFGYESCCPNDIKTAKVESNGEPLEVQIGTCYGGSIFAGSEIGTEIASHADGASIDITGLAASAAGVIAMFAHSRMSPTAMLMVHNVSGGAEGDYHAMDKEKSALMNANKAMAAAYVMKSGMSEKDALKMMDETAWLTAAQAKEMGLVDEIMFESVDPSQLVNSFGSGMIPKAVIEKTKAMLKNQQEQAPTDQQKQIDIARAKLNLYEKMI